MINLKAESLSASPPLLVIDEFGIKVHFLVRSIQTDGVKIVRREFRA